MRFFLILTCTMCLSPAVQAEPDYRAINTRLVEQVVIPAYSRLEQAAFEQKNRWIEACESPGARTIEVLRNAYHQTADAWAGVFHWTAGPITQELRRDRFYHWPERGNAVGKSLAELMAREAPDRLLPPVFARTTVAVQGLPALERLLFTDIDVTRRPWACQIGRAIAINLAGMATAVAREWRGQVLAHLAEGKPMPSYFGDPLSALNRFFTSLLTGFIMLKDQKLMPGLRSRIETANPKALEAWRSQRPLRNLQLGIDALAQTIDVLSKALPTGQGSRLLSGIGRCRDLAARLAPLDFGITDAAERRKLFELIDALTLTQTDTARLFDQGLGLTVGFNSLDGD